MYIRGMEEKEEQQKIKELVDLVRSKYDKDRKKKLSEDINKMTLPDQAKYRLEVELVDLQIKELKRSQKNRWNDLIRNILYIVLGGIIGIVSSLLLESQKKDVVLNPVVIPKIQVLHDTPYKIIYVTKPEEHKDKK